MVALHRRTLGLLVVIVWSVLIVPACGVGARRGGIAQQGAANFAAQSSQAVSQPVTQTGDGNVTTGADNVSSWLHVGGEIVSNSGMSTRLLLLMIVIIWLSHRREVMRIKRPRVELEPIKQFHDSDVVP